KTASLYAAGQVVAAGVIAVKVAALAEGVLKTMLLSKLKVAMAVLLTVVAVSIGAVGFADLTPTKEPPVGKANAQGQALAKANPELPEDNPQRALDGKTTKGTVHGVLEDVDVKAKTITVTLPEVFGINAKGGLDREKPVRLQDVPVAKRAKVFVNDKEGQLADLKRKMRVSVRLAVQDRIWVEEIDATD